MMGSSVFISYTDADAGIAKRLCEILSRQGIQPVCDDSSSYSGNNWPKTVGESIAVNDSLLLLWSQNSAFSKFVEFEWTTALAMGKKVIPCLLDGTPLAPSLRNFESVTLAEIESADSSLPEILSPSTDETMAVSSEMAAASSDILTKLEAIQPSDPEMMASAATFLLSSTSLKTAVPTDSNTTQSSSRNLQIGDVINKRYEITRILGQGGMGAVYRAYDKELERDVALKVIKPEFAADPMVLQRFKREIQLSSEVTHENVLRVFDLGECKGMKFLTMQLVEGEDLTDLLKRESPLGFDRVVHILRQVCKALYSAHAKGVVHRDLKPANIMIDKKDNVYLTDFGLARSLDQTGLTQAGQVMGTPNYMSPEQVKGETADQQSDIYSLGVILYEMVTGQVPFKGNSVFEVMMQRVQQKHRPVKELNPIVPDFLVKIIDGCMAREKGARYVSMQEILDDIEQGAATGRTIMDSRLKMRRWKTWTSSSAFKRALLLVPLFLLTIPGIYWIWTTSTSHEESALDQLIKQEPVSVLITDFKNETGNPLLDGYIEQTLEPSLEGASFITIFNRGRASRIASQLNENFSGLDVESARLVARREGISVIVSGSISQDEDGLRISAGAIDALTGDQIESRTVRADGVDAIPEAIARISSGIRNQLGDQTPESIQLAAAETFTSSSLEAAGAYSRAQNLQSDGNWEEAIAEYKKAIEIEPEFGRAYAGLAVMYRNLERRSEAEAQYQLALKYLDRMTEREKLKTRGGYFLIAGNYPKAIEELSELTEQFPADFAGYTNLALAHFYMRDMTSALTAARRASEIYPNNPVIRSNLAIYAMYAGDFDTAAEELEQLITVDSSYEFNFICLALSYIGIGKVEEAEGIYQRLAEIGATGASFASLGLADLYFYQGRNSEAVTVLREGIAADEGNEDQAAAVRKRLMLAAVLQASDRKEEAIQELDRALDLDRGARSLFLAAKIYSDSGLQDDARKLAAELAENPRIESQVYGKLIEGIVLLNEGNPWEALPSLHSAREMTDTWMGRFYLGQAYLAAKTYAEAYAEFERCLDRRGEATALFLDELPSIHLLPPVYYYLGLAQEGLGSNGAADSFRQYVSIKSGGEAQNLLADAEKRLLNQ